ncbi:MAG: helix-turn-helix domain-containing protein [Clostridiales bacterium]|jgi:transcriptional regulator with XRE-family HTH domain|nr:helix-turn-helix domain-containing protein [Clostridiales bacterium]
MILNEDGFILFHIIVKNIAQIFAENITRFRKKKGVSQYELAELSGISRGMISHYEREGMFPPADRLQSLADSLDVPVYKLFKGQGDDKTTDADFSGIDPRSVKKLKDILSLPAEDRGDLYRILNKMIRKNQLEKQNREALKMKRQNNNTAFP